MDDKIFKRLLKSAEQMGQIIRGERKPARVTKVRKKRAKKPQPGSA